MILVFDEFELDARKAELRRAGEAVALEPQVFALLQLLADNRDRLVTKDEIIEKVWDGRIISDSALTSRIKSLRAALCDDGEAQRVIRTLRGRGYRFVADARLKHAAREASAAQADAPDTAPTPALTARPSIVILPFRLVGVAGPYGGIADAVPDELITVLARLRWLFVIARGTAFRFRAPDQDIVEIGRVLGVRYCLTGVIELSGDDIVVAVELAETKNAGVLWGERFVARIDAIHEIREQIITSVVSSLELHIPMNEAQAARLASPDRLDAWSAYHLGLQHLYRFNRADNAAALALFAQAIERDPDFARAHAALSSAHFQNAFQRYGADRQADAAAARRHAERGVELDPLDPFVNFSMGRSFWVAEDIEGGTSWLDRAVALSPNYAQGFYARAWATTILGAAGAPREDVDMAMSLSPLDPFRYAMLGVRAFNCFVDGDIADAARFGEEAARAPGAHALIAAIAAALHALNGDEARAQRWADDIRARRPDLTRAAFFEAFPFQGPQHRARLEAALEQCGF